MRKNFLFFIFVLITGALWYPLWQHNPQIANENHLMENTQAFCLGLGVLFLLPGLWAKVAVEQKIIFSGLFLLYVTFFFREVPFDKIGAPSWVVLVFSGTGRNVILGLAWGVFLFVVTRRFRQIYSLGIDFLKTRAGTFLMVAGLFYILSWPFDKSIFPLSKDMNRFLEELVECYATLLMTISAFFYSKHAKKIKNPL